MPAHGLQSCSHVYPIPDGAKFLVISRAGDYRNTELLQSLKEQAVQIVLDDEEFATVFIWWAAIPPASVDAVDPGGGGTTE